MVGVTCIIVEDEEMAREQLRALVNERNDLQCVGEAVSVAEAKELVNTLNPQLLFLDINLKDASGFNLLDQINTQDKQVIFTTAYDEFAIKAFQYNALDYLLKPLDFNLFAKACDKAIERINNTQGSADQLKELLSVVNGDTRPKRIALPVHNGIEYILVNDIISCEADNNYTHIYVQHDRKITVSKTLKYFDTLLPEDLFFRVHQSHLVNLSMVVKFTKEDGGYLVLQNGNEVPVARRKKEALLELLG